MRMQNTVSCTSRVLHPTSATPHSVSLTLGARRLRVVHHYANAESPRVLHPTSERESSEDHAKACCENCSNEEKKFPSAKRVGRVCCGAAIPSPFLGLQKPLENQADNEAGVWKVGDLRRSTSRKVSAGTRCCRDLARGAQRSTAVDDDAKLVR